MPRNSACSSSHRQAVEKKVRISDSTACTGFFTRDHGARGEQRVTRAKA